MKGFAERAWPLSDLLVGQYINPQARTKLKVMKKPVPFEWKEEHQLSHTLIEK